MRHNEGYRRSRGAWQPTRRQREVLDALVEGKTNAEIAVRFGITVDGAKWHVGELMAQTGCTGRQALAQWWREQNQSRTRGWYIPALSALKPLAGLSVAAAVMLVAVAVLTSGGGDKSPAVSAGGAPSPTPWPEEAVEALAKQDAAPASCEPAQPQDLRIVSADELRAQGFVDLGRVLFAGHCPIYVANRVDRTLAWVGGGGYLRLNRSQGTAFGARVAQGVVTHRGGEFLLTAYALDSELVGGDPTRGLSSLDLGLMRLDHLGPAGSYVMLDLVDWLGTIPGRTAMGDKHRTLLASDGHVFFDVAALDGDEALNWLTGEAIDVGGLTPLGRLPLPDGRAIRNDCYAGHACSVQYDNGPVMPSPVAGLLRCVKDQRQDQAFRLEAPGLVLSLQGFGGYGFEPAECFDRPVSAGDALPHASYMSLEAYHPDGSPLSLVVTADGRLYAGQVNLRLDCPCEPRS